MCPTPRKDSQLLDVPGTARAAGFALVVVLALAVGARAGPPDTDPGPCPPNDMPARPTWELLPLHLLWQPPLASPHQPRVFIKATSLENTFTQTNIDTALGGTFGIVRFSPEGGPAGGVQLDFFGVNFGRWSERALSVASDYRYGFPLTFRHGPWQGKLAYEHTSTHVGDDVVQRFRRFKERYIRDEVVLGLAYRWFDQIRLYGEAAYAFSYASQTKSSRDRFAWGLEWSRQAPTGWRGQPFAAFDMDLRPELDYRPNVTLQVGWQWIPENRRCSVRAALELYDGRSAFGQFLTMKERWVGFGVFVDF